MVEETSGRPTGAAGVQIYPPPWYLNLVQRRLAAVADEHGDDDGAQTLSPAAEDDAELLALAEEIVGLQDLAGLPAGTKALVLGVHVAEVRAYLQEAARELRREPLAPAVVA